VLVLDGARKLGAKILVSGGGRCNVTNRVVTAGDFHGGSPNLIKRVLAALPVPRTVAFFQEIGVEVHEEEDGKLFPDTNRARTVLEALLGEAARRGVRILPEHRVTEVRPCAGGFQVTAAGAPMSVSHVVLSTGGQSLPKSGSDGWGYRIAEQLGHRLVPPTPALTPLLLEGDFHVPLSGVSHPVELTVSATEQKPSRVRGTLLWTHFGVSGPAVLDVSRHWHRAELEGHRPSVSVNFVPGADVAGVERMLLELAAAQPKTHLHNALARLLPARVAGALLEGLKIPGEVPMAHLPKEVRRRLVAALIGWPLPVRGSRGYGHAEATAGGVRLDEVEARSLASRRCPGLYFAGEILDVDGRIGGFNFQWAWSSAWVVATALARAMAPDRPIAA